MNLAITLIEVENTEAPNIGTIQSSSSNESELRQKAIRAIESHFDSKVISLDIQGGLGLSDVLNSPPLDAEVMLSDYNVKHKIELQQTWIY